MEHGDHVGVVVNHVEHEGKTERTPNIVGDDPGINSVEHDLVEVVHRVPLAVWCPLRHVCIISAIAEGVKSSINLFSEKSDICNSQ
jgi:hypothetical protein